MLEKLSVERGRAMIGKARPTTVPYIHSTFLSSYCRRRANSGNMQSRIMQVIGATCGDIHGGGGTSGSGNGTSVGVGTHAAATHRAAAFFGLPHLQRKVRDWLATNGAEMENDDGTAVLSATKTSGASRGGSARMKFTTMH